MNEHRSDPRRESKVMPICGTCQVAMHETYQVSCIYLDLNDKPAIIRYADEFECSECHRKFITGYAPYVAYATDPNFSDELRKAELFPEEVIYVYPEKAKVLVK